MSMIQNTSPNSYRRPIRLAEVLAALSLATDLGTGKPMGHAIRACCLGLKIANELRLSSQEQAQLYYSFLLMHSGCTVLSMGLAPVIQGDELAAIGDITLRDDANLIDMLNWMSRHVSPNAPITRRTAKIIGMLLHPQEAGDHLRGACEVAFQVAQRLGMPPGVQESVRYYLERWDGKGPFGLAGDAIPIKSRILHLALKMEAIYTAQGQAQAENMALERKGKLFDPQISTAFLTASKQGDLWEVLDKEDLWEVMMDLEPDSPYRLIDATKLDEVALAVADFVDLKSPSSVGHSRETARIAEGMACRMGFRSSEVANLRLAALVHDLGQVAVPVHILHPGAPLSEADKEKLRLHPYYTERILSRVPALAEVAAIAGMHHERINGSGYYRGLSGKDLPASACILALADEFQERLQAQPDELRTNPREVLESIQPEVGKLFSAECYEALAQELGAAAAKPMRRREMPAGLTRREIEVLQHVASGASNLQIAQELVISEKTVAHHLEHIYNKIGISSRAAAVFFAMENELIS